MSGTAHAPAVAFAREALAAALHAQQHDPLGHVEPSAAASPRNASLRCSSHFFRFTRPATSEKRAVSISNESTLSLASISCLRLTICPRAPS
jgi:hypothetical protein